MVKIFQKGERIEYTRGDTFLIRISPEDSDIFPAGATLEFVVADEPSKTPVIQNTYNLEYEAFNVAFSNKDKEIPEGKYVYKMILRTADGTVTTQKSGEFTVKWGA